MFCLLSPGWLDTLLWDERRTHGCGNDCLPLSLLANHQGGGRQLLHQFIWNSDLHWKCSQRAVPASQQHARVSQKKETHQTGTTCPATHFEERAQTKFSQPSSDVFCFCVQFEKQPLLTPSADSRTPFNRRHWRSRSLGGIIKVILCTVMAPVIVFHYKWCYWTIACCSFLFEDTRNALKKLLWIQTNRAALKPPKLLKEIPSPINAFCV